MEVNGYGPYGGVAALHDSVVELVANHFGEC